ncbi:nitrogen fixation regulation protein FixK [Tateyamaria omphalii]|uniref:helix-turn-helix domain-containing protein n=1 Tax=Tateyamaria omphalii TaxID=299262 RepID=UPI00167B0821|nr:helix-turn-helix domain-containing protein [Tateyamaria omphalii]GGX66043.1 nitrogen fixation regulation protein FixK [Tateyamaria omphalii]
MYITLSAETRPDPGPLTHDAANRMRPATLLKQGRHLFHEGDEVERIYQVKTGVVRLTRMLEDGRRQVIAFGYPGDIIGFPADGCHHTDCEALVDTTLNVFRRTALDHGDGDPELHVALLKAALKEISEMQDHVMMLGRKSASERVASFLAVITQRYGEKMGSHRRISLPMPRSDIADFLGLTTETVSRAFSALRNEGVIALNGAQTIIVMESARLQQLALGDD